MTPSEARARFIDLFQTQRPLTEPDLSAILAMIEAADIAEPKGPGPMAKLAAAVAKPSVPGR